MPQDFQSEFSKSETLFAPVFARTVNVKRLKAACLHGTLSSAVRSWFNTGWDTTTLTSFPLGGLFSCSPEMLEVAKESGFNAREWSAWPLHDVAGFCQRDLTTALTYWRRFLVNREEDPLVIYWLSSPWRPASAHLLHLKYVVAFNVIQSAKWVI